MNHLKKILWVNPSFLDYRIPLYNELNKLNCNNFFLIYSKNRIPKRCDNRVKNLLGDNAISIEKEKILHIGSKSDLANKSLSIPFPKGLYSSIKSINPDIIITEGFFQFTPWSLLYSILNRKKIYIVYERTKHTERHCPFWRRYYRKFINLFVDGYLVNGSLTKEYLISNGVKPDIIYTGAMCADSLELRKEVNNVLFEDKLEFKRKLNISNEGLVFIYVGQIIERKGVVYLLEAWQEYITTHPNDYLLIVGDGILLEEYKNEFKNTPSIIFTNKVDYSLIYKYYSISDVFIIPTLEDNWSLVVPEAMACGLPIACSIYNGCYPELVKEGINGKLFDPLKRESILESLKYFHNVDIKKFSTKSIEIESKYSPSNVALNIFNAIKK